MIGRAGVIDALQASAAVRGDKLYTWGETRQAAYDKVREAQTYRRPLSGESQAERVQSTGLVPANAVPVAVAFGEDITLQLRASYRVEDGVDGWIGDSSVYVTSGPARGAVEVTRFGAFFGVSMRDGHTPERMRISGVQLISTGAEDGLRFAVYGALGAGEVAEGFVTVFSQSADGAWSSATHRLPKQIVTQDGSIFEAPFVSVRGVQGRGDALLVAAEFGLDARRTSGVYLLSTSSAFEAEEMAVLGVDPLSLNPDFLDRDRVRFVGFERLAGDKTVLVTRRTRVTEDAAEYSLIALGLAQHIILHELQWRDPDTRRGRPGLAPFTESDVMLFNIGEQETRIEIFTIP